MSTDEAAQAAVERAVLARARALDAAPTLALLAAFQPILRGVTDAALTHEDERTATLCSWLGLHLKRLGSYAPAQSYLERALAICERVLGPEHPDTANSLNNLAGLHQDQGDYAPARPLLERALTIRERVLGPEHPDTARSLANLAILLFDQGDFASAIPLMERALRIRRRSLGPTHPHTMASERSLEVMRRAAARGQPGDE